MLVNLLFGLPTMAVCLFLQSILVVYALRYYANRENRIQSPTFGTSLLVINGVMLALIIGNIAQVMIWAYCSCSSASFPTLIPPCITRRSTSPRSATATS